MEPGSDDGTRPLEAPGCCEDVSVVGWQDAPGGRLGKATGSLWQEDFGVSDGTG